MKRFWSSFALGLLLSAPSVGQDLRRTVLYFPDYVEGGGWSVQLALSNPARRATAAVVVSAFDQEGRPVTELFDSETAFEVPPLGSRVLRSAGAGEIRRGWIEVRTDPPSVSGLLTYRNSETGVEVGVAPVELGDRFALFVEETSEVGAGLAVYKPDPDSRIELRIRDESGRDPLEGAIIPGESFRQSARTISEWFDVDGVDRGFLRDFRGLLLLRTEDESGFAPLGLRFGKGTGALSAVPLIRDQTQEAGARTLIFPDYVEGDGWSVQLALSNVDPDASAQVVVNAFDPDFTFVPDLFDSEAEFEIPPLGSRVLRSTGAGEIRRGWIEVWTGTSGVSGSLIYGHSGTGVEVGVAPVEQGNHFALFVEETGEVGAGLAVSTYRESRIELRLRDESGRDPLDDVFIPWSGFWQSARTISEWFDVDGVDRGFLRDFRGLLFLRTADGSPFAPLGLRFGKGTGALSAVPVIRIVDGDRIDGGVEIDGGVGIDGGGHARAAPPTVTLQVYPGFFDLGESVSLWWSSTNAESAEITPDVGEVPIQGERRASPTRTTTYRITVRGVDGQTATDSVTVTLVGGSVESDRQALEALYEATDGPNWRNNDNWLTDAPLGDWYGVETSASGRVVGLDLGERWDGDLEEWIQQGLSGSIPPEIGNLSALRSLGLGGNDLSGEIPAEIGNLTALEDLDLSWNAFSGPIPPETGNLAALRFLRLGGNDLSGPIPESFLEIRALEYFSFDGNADLCVPGTTGFVAWLGGVTTYGPYCNEADRGVLERLYETAGGTEWTNSSGWLETPALEEWYGVTANSLGRVVGLNLAGNGLTGELLADFGSLTDLTTLRIGDNALSGRLPLSLADLPSLVELHYADTGLCAPAELASWLDGIVSHEGRGCGPHPDREALEALYEATDGPNWRYSDNWLTDAPLGDWDRVDTDVFGHVTRLVLSANLLSGRIPIEPLARLKRLSDLGLSYNQLSGPIPPELGQLDSLEYLGLYSNRLSGPIPRELGNLKRLGSLFLDSNDLSGAIPPELGQLEDLGWLGLSNNRLTGPIPPELGKLENVWALALTSNQLTGRVPPELGNMSNLRELYLSNNRGLRGALPASLTDIPLDELTAGGTDLCVPEEIGFQAWLRTIRSSRIVTCGSRPAMAYLTQAVQSRTYPVPLVAGEQALLRVFVTATRATSAGIPPVRARFYVNGTERHVADIPAKTTSIPINVSEGDLDSSSNAVIPGPIVQPGLEMVIEVDPGGTLDTGLLAANRIPETGRMAVEVHEMPTFAFKIIPFLWRTDPDRAIVDIAKGMAADPDGHEMLWHTRTLLPIDDFDITVHEPVWTSTNETGVVGSETAAIRALEGEDPYDVYYVAMMSGSTRGPAYAGWGQAFSWPDSAVFAHEMGHTLNLGHAPCGGPGELEVAYPYPDGSTGAWGYDFRRGGRLVPPTRYDLMSYCDPKWISDYLFTKALRYFLSNPRAPRVPRPPSATLAPSVPATAESLLLWGGIDTGGEPFLNPAFVVDAPSALPGSDGEFDIIGRSAGGGVLFALNFAMPEFADLERGSSFAFVLPVRPDWAENLASITLSGPVGSVTINEDTDRPVTILRNSRTGQIRAILRGAEAGPQNLGATVSALSLEPGLERLTSRGIPDRNAWTQ